MRIKKHACDAVKRIARNVLKKAEKVSAVKPVAVSTKKKKRGRKKKNPQMSAVFVRQIITVWK